jgi:hypothetical protein
MSAMAGPKKPRSTNPETSVLRWAAGRRGVVGQAEIRKTQREVERLGGAADEIHRLDRASHEMGQLEIYPSELQLAAPFVIYSGGGVRRFLVNVGDFSIPGTIPAILSFNLSDGMRQFFYADDFVTQTIELDGLTGNIAAEGTISAAGGFVDALTEVAEDSQVNVAGGTNGALGSDTRRYSFYTMPTDEKVYLITGIEWRVGATSAGNIYCGVDLVNANPPTGSGTAELATGLPKAVGATSTNQRNSDISSRPIRGGSHVGAWIAGTNNSATFGKTTVASANNSKIIVADPPTLTDFTAWTPTTDEWFIKIYYVGYS